MLVVQEKTIEEAYEKLVKNLLSVDLEDGFKEITNCCLEIEYPSLTNIHFPYRIISTKYANSELKWYWSGSNKVSDISNSAQMWAFLSDDGVTNNSAYGYILNKKYNYNQIESVIDLLKNDKNSKRAVLSIFDPKIDKIKTKDLQCTLCINFLIRNEKLEMTVYMRSNDIYFGLPYDYIYFVSIQKYIAKRLNISSGKYTHIATSMHMYERDIEKFKNTTSNSDIFTINYKEIIEENYEK